MRAIIGTFAAALAVCVVMQQAQTADEKADFELVQKIGSRRAYEVFLKTHPDGYYAETVRSRLGQMQQPPLPPQDRRLQPNWGDHLFIPRIIDKQR